MENLFRFLLVRPAEAVDEKNAAVALKMATPLQTAMADALSLDSPREAVKEVIGKFIDAEERYIDHPLKLNHYPRTVALRY